jgi:hypothetical protein
MKENIRIFGDEDLVDQAPIGALDGSRKWQKNIASCTALPREQMVATTRIACSDIRSHYSGNRGITGPLIENSSRKLRRGDSQT